MNLGIRGRSWKLRQGLKDAVVNCGIGGPSGKIQHGLKDVWQTSVLPEGRRSELGDSEITAHRITQAVDPGSQFGRKSAT